MPAVKLETAVPLPDDKGTYVLIASVPQMKRI
jgi:Uri superfamily endonuclease